MLPIKLIDKLVLGTLVVILLVDMVNGIGLRLGMPSIAVLVKTALFVLMLVRIVSIKPHWAFLLLVPMTILSIGPIYSFLRSGGSIEHLSDFTVMMRFSLIPVSFGYGLLLFKTIKEQPKAQLFFLSFIYVNAIILVVNLLLGLLGIGYEQYEGGVGSVGFFYAGNEVSAVMIILFCFLATICYKQFGIMKYFLISICLLVISVIKATKVGIIGTILILIATPLMHKSIPQKINFRKFSMSKALISFIFIGIVSLTVFLFVVYISNSFLYTRLEYFYEISDGLTHFLLSGRNYFAKYTLLEFSNYNIFEILFGKGTYGALNLMIPYFGGAKSVEIDFLDFLFQYGLMGVAIVYGFHIYLTIRSITQLKNRHSNLAVACVLSNILILLVSITAGHVFNAGMPSVFIGITNASLTAINKN
jgi:hypothetical protein